MKCLFAVWMYLLTGIVLPVLARSGNYETLIREAELAGNREKVAALCKEWYASGQFSVGLLNWNYNALMSVEQNALLFTQQESDTYPAMLLQYALDVRPDVSVINAQMLENQQYRAFLIALERWTWIPQECSMSDFWKKLLRPDETDANRKAVYFGSMALKHLPQIDREKLYLTGLALKYSTLRFDNIAVLRYNYENRFRTDYLGLRFDAESDPAAVTQANLNYIPALLLLHRHYSGAGETQKAEQMEQLALSLSRAGGREAELRAFFEPEQPRAILSDITPKSLEKHMKKVGDRLFASDIETSNAQYQAFLQDLLKNKDFDQLAICRMHPTDWLSLLPENMRNLSPKILFAHGHPDDDNAPVQHISYEAAQRYCAWMTQVYNASTDKKKYKKVLFRLPTEEEWMMAARAGRKDVPYPWGGYFVRNAKGCYLANYDALTPCGDCPERSFPLVDNEKNAAATPSQGAGTTDVKLKDAYDGGYFTLPVESYFPNDFGLYAVSGNVAEMIAEPGKAKGGSWRDEPYYGQITPVKTYDGPSPSIGFRVFMEVIEE